MNDHVTPPHGSVVAFLAVGTRGDVQPLAILAATLAKRRGFDVHFITNRKHRTVVEAALTSAGVCSVKYLSLPPATPVTTDTDESSRGRQQRVIDDERHREVRARAS